ncbi:hypothetical protein RFI_09821 [Reticulomyxa filosa]|uniref:Uncharacterized protein n=1 Tax=Reticulomyxa filosa TaxID=46433 RepID=X6NNM4_RETFI|nr:hypothetical protein RFI_09821 [Reticulomyxa filosa]|eukprot:ETO27309.1 hypothetical protein RFI_09821 [Reticulomyxa filosa]
MSQDDNLFFYCNENKFEKECNSFEMSLMQSQSFVDSGNNTLVTSSNNSSTKLQEASEALMQQKYENEQLKQQLQHERGKNEEIVENLLQELKNKSERVFKLSVQNAQLKQGRKDLSNGKESSKELSKIREAVIRANESLDSLRSEKEVLEPKHSSLVQEKKTFQQTCSAPPKKSFISNILTRCKNLKEPLKEIKTQMSQYAQMMDTNFNGLRVHIRGMYLKSK